MTSYMLFYKQHLYKQLAKNQEKARQHPEAELFLFENDLLSSSMLSAKSNKRYSKKSTTKQFCLF